MVEKIFEFFDSPFWKDLEQTIKPISFLVTLLFLWVIFWSLKRSDWVQIHFTYDLKNFLLGEPPELREKIKKKWEKIERRFKSKEEAEWKLAVIEAEEILSDILFEKGYSGKDLKEQLTKMPQVLAKEVENLQRPIQIYENIIKDPDYALNKEEAKEAFLAFKNFWEKIEYF